MDWTAMASPWLRKQAETDATHRPVLEGLMARAGLRSGQHVLDIGPGAGVSLIEAARAVGPTGRVTGVEIAPPFVARARARVPENVSVLEGDAARYPFQRGAYDAAISLLGVMFFADSLGAFRHIRQALTPGGTLSFACWGPPEANPYFAMPARVARDVFGPGPKPDLNAPGPMRFGDPVALQALLIAAGWAPEVETVDLLLTPQGGPEDVAHMLMTIGAAASRMGAEKAEGRLSDTDKKAVRAGLVSALAEFTVGGDVRLPAQVHFVRAVA